MGARRTGGFEQPQRHGPAQWRFWVYEPWGQGPFPDYDSESNLWSGGLHSGLTPAHHRPQVPYMVAPVTTPKAPLALTARKEISFPSMENGFPEQYSFFSVGSDQIWGWFSGYMADFVFMKFAPIEKRITFAPSSGGACITNEAKTFFAEGIKGIKNVSVREALGVG